MVKGGSVIGWPHSEAHPGSSHTLPSISSSLMNNLICKIHRRNTRWPCWKSKCSQVSHLNILCQPKVNSSHASAVLYIWCLVVYIWYSLLVAYSIYCYLFGYMGDNKYKVTMGNVLPVLSLYNIGVARCSLITTEYRRPRREIISRSLSVHFFTWQ